MVRTSRLAGCGFSFVREIKVEITTRCVNEWMTPVPRLRVELLNRQTASQEVDYLGPTKSLIQK